MANRSRSRLILDPQACGDEPCGRAAQLHILQVVGSARLVDLAPAHIARAHRSRGACGIGAVATASGFALHITERNVLQYQRIPHLCRIQAPSGRLDSLTVVSRQPRSVKRRSATPQ